MSRKKELAVLGERYLSFDRQEIRAKILLPTYAAARRRSGSIYCTLIKELYEEYCPTTAGYFEEMVIKEQQLLAKQAIREQVCNEPYLLFSLYDHCKMAERAVRLEGIKGQDVCVRLLFQCMFFCEDFEKLFNWLNEDVYEIVAKICNGLTEKLTIAETLCKINFKYGQILTNKDIRKAINYLQNAFDLAKGNNWLTKVTDEITRPTSDLIAEQLVETLLKCAYLEDSAAKAASRAEQALLAISKSGESEDVLLIMTIYLDLAHFLLEDSKFDKCLKALNCVNRKLANYSPNYEPYRREFCRFLSLKARYLNRIEKKDIALYTYSKAIKLAKELDMKRILAQCLTDMAKIYLEHGPSQTRLAEQCLLKSREILTTLKDVESLKLCNYDLARVKSRLIHGDYMEAIKNSSTSRCELHRLLEWKTRCKPFWVNRAKLLQLEQKDPVACLLQSTKIH